MTTSTSLSQPAAGFTHHLSFHYTFTVPARVEQVAAFHRSPKALVLLTPPPLRVQLLEIAQPAVVSPSLEEIVEGTCLRFILWLGPFPIRWEAVHTEVGPGGFTDTQVSGPLAFWRHTHTFSPRPDGQTQVYEQITARYFNGLRGLWSRVVFSTPGLRFLFTFRKRATLANIGKYHEK
jgi:ligand-binding SRPBCC domain-containing protein